MNFSEWITKKYIEWRGDSVGHDRSITDFAKSVGVSQSLMSHWMNGDRAPSSHKTISKLGAIYPEVYEVLGIDRPQVDSALSQLPEPFKDILESALAEINARFQQEGVSPENDPDGERVFEITREVFDKYGVDITIKETDVDGSER